MNNNFTPEESLSVIHRAINQTHQNIKEDSIHFLIWGWATLIASIAHYILLTIVHYQHPYIAWTLMPIAGVIAGIVGFKAAKKVKVKTHIHRILGYLWGGFGVYLLILLVFMPVIGFDKTYPLIIGFIRTRNFYYGGHYTVQAINNWRYNMLGHCSTFFYAKFSKSIIVYRRCYNSGLFNSRLPPEVFK